MSVAIIAVLTIAFLFLIFLSGMGIGLAIAFAGFVGFALLVNVEAALNLVAVDVYSVFSSYAFTCIPLFVFMGKIAARAGIAKVPIGLVYKGIYPFLIGMTICVFILMFVPQISLWLPDMLIK